MSINGLSKLGLQIKALLTLRGVFCFFYSCDAGLSNRHNVQGGTSPRWHGNGWGHSQISEDDTHSGWISGIAQYGLSAESEVTFSFDDTPNKVGLQWTVNTGSSANSENPTITEMATFVPDEHSVELGVLRHRYSNHQSSDRGQGINLASLNMNGLRQQPIMIAICIQCSMKSA